MARASRPSLFNPRTPQLEDGTPLNYKDRDHWSFFRMKLTSDQVKADLAQKEQAAKEAKQDDPMGFAMKQQIEEMHAQINVMNDDIGGIMEAYNKTEDELSGENAQLRADIINLVREANQARARAGIPSTEAGGAGQKKSTKLPPPQPLVDGVNPFIDDWTASIRNILVANADHYPTPAAQIAYVEGLVHLPAKQYIRDQLKPDHPQAFQNAEQVLSVLQKRLGKSREVIENEAKKQMRKCFQGKRPFREFWTDLQHLASVLGYPDDWLLKELKDRITPELMLQMATNRTTDPYAFAEECQRMEIVITEAEETKRKMNRIGRYESKTVTSGPQGGQKKTTISRPSSPAVAPRMATSYTKPRPQHSDPHKQALSDKGACFICEETGHMAKDCPTKLEVAPLLEGTESASRATSSSTSSGKDQL